ncbi:SCO1860 family LAETG-anchored protein [Peterkaempfera bronchialis]|uniref:LPXTG cell wall anchor domain-containing protein n=1 Tax=Peterkaempfera bronchialis TaxID=2126346 RepID=A0A345T1X3_9ACTN|nr:SCO1860 family LAETG-anchored protein [Peterkaempfera bronchialis]AXI79978.1 hypothetical protein C7M71_023835 [Peterkaempfera bronchialis]
MWGFLLSSVFSVIPRFRPGAVAVLAAGMAVAGLPATAHATGDSAAAGRASAVTAEVQLHVSLLNKTLDVPVDLSLGRVTAPGQSGGTMLSARVDGVDRGAPVTLVKADVGNSDATVDAHGARASVKLVGARVHLPGLPFTTLLALDTVNAEVGCPVHGQPTAKAEVLGTVKVLGRTVSLSAGGPTRVKVPGVGEVSAELSKRAVTTSTAAATALELDVTVDPLALNVAKVTGRVAVASVDCEKPRSHGGGGDPTPGVSDSPDPSPSEPPSGSTAGTSAGTSSGTSAGTSAGTSSGSSAGSSSGASAGSSGASAGTSGSSGGSSQSPAPTGSASTAGATAGATAGGSAGGEVTVPQATGADLAETGSSGTPLMLGGAAVLVGAGVAAMIAVRRRRTSHSRS